MKVHGVIVGAGQVGRGLYDALSPTYPKINIHDTEEPSYRGVGEILHSCIPWTKSFVKYTLGWVDYHDPGYVVIHSTTPVGTTREIARLCPDVAVFHSPVRGKHPDLAESIVGFKKMLGPARADDYASLDHVVRYFERAGLTVDVYKNSDTTELAKLVSTTTYGLLIAFHQEIERWCKEYDVDYDEVVTRSTRTYNEGYRLLGMDRFARPTIYPGHMGGHCVMQNIRILLDSLDSDFLEDIIKSNDRKESGRIT